MIENLASFWVWLTEVVPAWYVYIGMAYMLFHLALNLWHDAEMFGQFLLGVFWYTLLLPLLLGILWPLSMLLHIAHHVLDLEHHWFFRQLYGHPWKQTYTESKKSKKHKKSSK